MLVFDSHLDLALNAADVGGAPKLSAQERRVMALYGGGEPVKSVAYQLGISEETAKSYSSAEVEVGIVSVPPSPFGGLGPAEIQLVAPYYHAGYLKAETTGNGRASRTSIALTRHGRAALDTYTDALRDLLGGL